MLPWKLRKRQILPANQNLFSVYFPLAKFQPVSCNLFLAMIWQMTYTHNLPKLCSATLIIFYFNPLTAVSAKTSRTRLHCLKTLQLSQSFEHCLNCQLWAWSRKSFRLRPSARSFIFRDGKAQISSAIVLWSKKNQNAMVAYTSASWLWIYCECGGIGRNDIFLDTLPYKYPYFSPFL